MQKFRDHIIAIHDLSFGNRVGFGSAGVVRRAKLRRHTNVAVKTVEIPVRVWAVPALGKEWLAYRKYHTKKRLVICDIYIQCAGFCCDRHAHG